jgi:hypothetical protein
VSTTAGSRIDVRVLFILYLALITAGVTLFVVVGLIHA